MPSKIALPFSDRQPKPSADVVSFLLVNPTSTPSDYGRQLSDFLGDEPFEISPVFTSELNQGEGRRYEVLTLRERSFVGRDAEVFDFAHHLRDELGLSEVQPLFSESLFGSVTQPPELRQAEVHNLLLSGICSNEEIGPAEPGWAPRGHGVAGAWALAKQQGKNAQGDGAVICQIDTGYSSHVELQDALMLTNQVNLVEGGVDASDRFGVSGAFPNPGHGTLGISVMASRGTLNPDGTTGAPGEVTGTAPAAKVMPIRAITSVIDFSQITLARGIEAAIVAKADVISMAIGGPSPVAAVRYALEKAAAAGIVTIVAAGNCWGPVCFPAAFAAQGLATAIAGVDYLYQPWEFTCSGPEVTVSAFGTGVFGASKHSAAGPDNVVKPSQGTTLATALSAGVAALWVAFHGRDAIRQAAAQQNVTVQRLFMKLLAASSYHPSIWDRQSITSPGHTLGDGLGAGVVNADMLLRLPLGGHFLSEPVGFGKLHYSLLPYVRSAIEKLGESGSSELDEVLEPNAFEMARALYLKSARRRQRNFYSAILGGHRLEIAPEPPAERSTELTGKLDTKPRLKAALS